MKTSIFNPMIIVSIVYMYSIALADNSYIIKTKDVLCSDVQAVLYTLQMLPMDKEEVIVILNEQWPQKLQLFYRKSGHWNSTRKELSRHTRAGLFSEEENCVLYTVSTEIGSNKISNTEISFYRYKEDLWNLSHPDKIVRLIPEKAYQNEYMELIPLIEKPKTYLLTGAYTKIRYDPLSILGNIVSGGHGGFAIYPFLMELSEESTGSYYVWPEKMKTTETVKFDQLDLTEGVCHLVGIKYKIYMPSKEKVVYANFNVEKKNWNKPQTVYEGSSKTSFFGYPVIQTNNGQIVIAWALRNDDRLGSGIFICEKSNEKWNTVKKLSSLFDQPLLTENKDGNSCVLWREDNKGILLSVKEGNQWSTPCLIVNDNNIGTKNVPWDIKSDKDGNFHIVYSSRKMDSTDPHIMNVIYVYLER